MSESAEKPSEDDAQPIQPQTTSATSAPSDRIELVSRARTFLSAPEIRSQDLDAKATFLSEKGLTSNEINRLLRELPPPIPPRTYPPSLPSALPSLLLGVARVLTWITGSSAVVFLIYYHYLLPRLSKSYEGRLALRNHQLSLLSRLRDSAERLKSEQSQSYKEFPRLLKYHEEEPFASFERLDDVIAHMQLSRSNTPLGSSASPSVGANRKRGEEVPELTILRCGLNWKVHQHCRVAGTAGRKGRLSFKASIKATLFAFRPGYTSSVPLLRVDTHFISNINKHRLPYECPN
ncbi:hypothetical protein BKA82DRAFT_3553619 [Pisolithus tinctorius]|nr:hypothetical protein BKA82DRAFT_3553619 [Pisolithus tinctorius]